MMIGPLPAAPPMPSAALHGGAGFCWGWREFVLICSGGIAYCAGCGFTCLNDAAIWQGWSRAQKLL
jgi:hypothetical protein